MPSPGRFLSQDVVNNQRTLPAEVGPRQNLRADRVTLLERINGTANNGVLPTTIGPTPAAKLSPWKPVHKFQTVATINRNLKLLPGGGRQGPGHTVFETLFKGGTFQPIRVVLGFQKEPKMTQGPAR